MISAGLMRISVKASQRCITRQPVRQFRLPKQKVEPKQVKAMKVESVSKEAPKQLRTESKPSNSILGKYLLYTAVSVPTFFTGCIIWNYESHRNFLKRGMSPSIHNPTREKKLGFREHINAIWNRQMTRTQRVFVTIASMNAAVFLLWKVPSLTPIMYRYFLCMPSKAHSVVASTLSAFSHQSLFHLVINMYVLSSFCVPLCYSLGQEQFLAVYLSGGTFAGLTSAVYRVTTGRMIPSLGASGAVLALVGALCMMQPESRLSIAFVSEIFPHSFSARSGLIGLMMLDCIGLLRGWRMLDHAAHLGGVIFGLLYVQFGQKIIWKTYRENLLRKWNAIRNR